MEVDDTVELETFAYFESGGLVVLCNILDELQENGIITMNRFISTEVEDDRGPLGEGPFPQFVTEGCFKEIMGDHWRYVRHPARFKSLCSCFGSYEIYPDGMHELGVSQNTTILLHDPEDLESRRRVQQYFQSPQVPH